MLSLPSFDVRSGLGVENEVVEVFPLTLGKALEPPEFVEDVAGVLSDLEEVLRLVLLWKEL